MNTEQPFASRLRQHMTGHIAATIQRICSDNFTGCRSRPDQVGSCGEALFQELSFENAEPPCVVFSVVVCISSQTLRSSSTDCDRRADSSGFQHQIYRLTFLDSWTWTNLLSAIHRVASVTFDLAKLKKKLTSYLAKDTFVPLIFYVTGRLYPPLSIVTVN